MKSLYIFSGTVIFLFIVISIVFFLTNLIEESLWIQVTFVSIGISSILFFLSAMELGEKGFEAREKQKIFSVLSEYFLLIAVIGIISEIGDTGGFKAVVFSILQVIASVVLFLFLEYISALAMIGIKKIVSLFSLPPRHVF